MTDFPDTHAQELFLTQRAFRAVMNAMARPGLVHCVPPIAQPTQPNPCLETLTQMLIDSTCGFCVAASDEQELARDIASRSYAVQTPPEQALFAVIAANADTGRASQVLRELSGGTDESPELGATALIECEGLDALVGSIVSQQAQWFSVTGPGVANKHFFSATNHWWHEARERRADEFPCGIDLILVDRSGNVVALPRTAQLERVEATAEECDSWPM